MVEPTQVERIKKYAKTLNSKIEDGELLNFVVDEVIDRVLVYLNDASLDSKLERVVARIVASIFTQSLASQTGEIIQEISSISDNGQAIHYASGVKNYLVSSDDNELFSGCSKLLAPYRRVNVHS